MGTPKKPLKKKPASNNTGAKEPGLADEGAPQKKIVADDDDFEEPLDDLEGYESYNDYDEDEDDDDDRY